MAFASDAIHLGLFRPPQLSSPAYLGALSATATPQREHAYRSGGGGGDDDVTPWHLHLVEDGPAAAADDDVLGPRAASLPRQPVYALAGHLGTPGSGPDDSGTLGESMYSDSNYRRALGSKRSRQDADLPDPARPTPLFCLPDKPAAAAPRPWTAAAALTTLGGVVDRVWRFCKAGAFRGFYAGGGRGYPIDAAAAGPPPGSGPHGDGWGFPGPGPRAPPRRREPLPAAAVPDRDGADDSRPQLGHGPGAPRRRWAAVVPVVARHRRPSGPD